MDTSTDEQRNHLKSMLRETWSPSAVTGKNLSEAVSLDLVFV